MRKKTILLLVVGLVLIAAIGWAYSNWETYAPTVYVQESADSDDDNSESDNSTETSAGTAATATAADLTIKTTTVNTKTGTTIPGAPSFTSEQVAAHDDAASCYTAISGKVYDLTLWINMHPGGQDKILSICGIDGTARFMAKHKGAQKQMDILKRFYIGDLSN